MDRNIQGDTSMSKIMSTVQYLDLSHVLFERKEVAKKVIFNIFS